MALAATLRKVAGATTLVLASVAITLVLAEMVLRHTPYADLRLPNYNYPEDYFVADDVLGYDILPNVTGKTHAFPEQPYDVFSNRYGCFDFDRDVPKDYTLIVGDSMAWGYTPLPEKWTTKLEALSGQFTLKCGVTGYGTKQELLKAQKVVEQVGHAPKHIIAMYIVNDLNDDYLFPQRTVYGSSLISSVNTLDLQSGEISRRTIEEIAIKNAKYKDGTLSNRWHKWREGMVILRLIKIGKEQAKSKLEAAAVTKPAVASAPTPKAKTLPTNTTAAVYSIMLAGYLDTDRPWFNKAIEDHKRNILAMAEYADSIGAKLLFIDPYGLLQHRRFEDVRSFFAHSPRHDYYNLQADYYPFDTWQHDAHWNITGNHKAAQHIYAHTQAIGFFED